MVKEYRSPITISKFLKQLKLYDHKNIDVVIECAGEFYNIALVEYNEEYDTIILHTE